MTLTADLGPGSRAKHSTPWRPTELDVLVVGAGVVGAGTALDAVSRGLSTALVEQRDFASGTSSRSSKLVHGGLRYLEMFDFALVREALEERGLLLTRIAPHLVRPVPFLYPLHHTWERPYVGAGLVLYDGMAMAGKYEMGVPKHKHLFRKQLARMAPDLRTEDAHRRDPLLRLPGRRRPAGDEHRPHGRGVRRPRRLAHQGDRASSARAAGSSASASRTWRTTASSRSAPRWSSTPAASGPTRSRRCSAAAERSTSRPARASTSSCPVTASAARPASSPRPRSRCCS